MQGTIETLNKVKVILEARGFTNVAIADFRADEVNTDEYEYFIATFLGRPSEVVVTKVTDELRIDGRVWATA